MINADALVPLNDLIDEIGRDKFNESALDECTLDGNNYAVPLYSHAMVMWIRKDLLEENNLEVPKTWDELYEAAEVDGAVGFKKHMLVTIPHIMPMIALVSTISSISALKVFVEIYVMTKGGPLNSTKTIVYYIYEKAFENLDLGLASAGAVILLFIVMAFSMINIFVFEKDKYKL